MRATSRLTKFLTGTSYGLRAQLLRSAVDTGLQKWNEQKQVRRYSEPRKGVHVGNLLGEKFCERQCYYAHTLGEKGFTITSSRRLLTWFEGLETEAQFKKLLDWARDFGGAAIKRIRLEQERYVGKLIGSPDVAFRFMGKRWIAEVKSMNFHQFRRLARLWPAVLQQLAAYMVLYGVPRGVVPVKGKGMDDWKFFEVRLKDVEGVGMEVVHRGLRVWKAMQRGVPPRRYCGSPKDKKAKNCAYRMRCFFGIDANVP